MKTVLLISMFVLIFCVACRPPDENITPQNAEEITHDTANPYLEQADEAIRALQSGLVNALTSAINEGGPGSAVFICRDEAREIAARVAEETGIAVGRTSHRLRNLQNLPPPWAGAIVQKAAGRKIEEAESHVFDLGDSIAVIKPIGTIGLCTHCHGKSSEIEGEVKQALAKAYPNDSAVGFSAGDLRGWMWAEVAK